MSEHLSSDTTAYSEHATPPSSDSDSGTAPGTPPSSTNTSWPATSDTSLDAYDIPLQFWARMKENGGTTEPIDALHGYFNDIWHLWKEWVDKGRRGFVTKHMIGMNSDSYRLLLDVLEQAWQWELEGGVYGRWVAFLRCMRADLFVQANEVVAIAPTFDEDFSPVVSAKRVITNSDVQFRLNYASITLDIGHEGEPEYEPNNSDIFMCLVTQSREEFLYQTRKIALALTRSLVGFFIVLVAGLPSQQPDPDVSFKTSVLQETMSGLALRFKTRVRDGSNFDHWQEDYHFMRLLEANGMPLTSPPEAYLRFRACVKSIIRDIVPSTVPRAPWLVCYTIDSTKSAFATSLGPSISLRWHHNQSVDGCMYVGCVIGGARLYRWEQCLVAVGRHLSGDIVADLLPADGIVVSVETNKIEADDSAMVLSDAAWPSR
ncbi:uncharacterized protein B0H18DRAFT_960259 [Fomitopsis serialis]|uniref:uncharacterized protein n=1 Tax=Fomitopsis serialis TaxID=139415 RepID=UPI002008AB22|nr:uncharacterized protein B0H18DRAFT_960259 [Neoantrodia serialis]KAH9913528.1 hypothetical protein B0H18DRAFT_960259 [Neoantrodia serialis]